MHFDIAVVGFGPVGAMTALQMANAGLRVVIVEKSTDVVELPRAVNLDGESIRSFQRIGFGDAAAGICQPPREKDEVAFTNSRREPLFGATLAGVGEHGWRDMAFFDQPELEALMRGWVAREPLIEVRLGHEAASIHQTADGVSLECTVVKTSETASVNASFLIGCDGASSFVREALGISWQSLGYDQDWLVVDITQGPNANLPLVTMQVCDPARLTTYVCVKDPNRRWEFQLVEGETRDEMLLPETIHALIAPWTARENYEIRRAAVYQFHAATADRWQVGRVFLAGDAAHQTPPFLGQGLNAGMRDAVNLGWKIPLVMSGICDQSLLESYAAERDAHARDLVEWAVAIGQLMETLAAREAGLRDPYPADQSSGYGQGRTAPPLRGGVLLMEQCLDEKSPVGSMMRQPTVRDETGASCRLDELLDAGFSVVGRTQADLEIGPDALQILDRIGGRVISLEDLEMVEGELDRLFDVYAVAVLRPDRTIFGVVDEAWDLDRILIELGAKLNLV